MRKKLVSGLLAATMVASLMVGCGSDNTTSEAPASDDATTTDDAASSDDAAEPAATGTGTVSDDGKVLNISCWNEEFKSRVIAHYPGYEEVDATTGKIGDVEVHWNITPSDDNAYQNKLDETLPNNIDAAADDKVDLFLMEADYALKYVNSDVSLDVINDVGVDESLLANQYQYTKDVVTDSNGALKGVSWQGCPGVMIYRRDIAKDVWGTDDPDEIQTHFGSWDDFNKAAEELNAKGYQITATVNDTYRVYSNNVSSKWVEDGKINIDPQIKAWAESSKEMADKGYTSTEALWSDGWNKGMQTDAKVFCYFGPAWLIDFSMHVGDEGMAATDGLYAATKGPQGFFWGGTWIAGANGTDNVSLVKDIIEKMTTDESILTDIVKDDNDFVNNKNVMNTMAADTSYSNDILGGQNALGIFAEGAESIDLSNLSNYDQGCNEEFQAAMKNWFDGSYASYDEAVQVFYDKVIEKYPELTKPE